MSSGGSQTTVTPNRILPTPVKVTLRMQVQTMESKAHSALIQAGSLQGLSLLKDVSGAEIVVVVRALEPLTLATWGVHSLPHLAPNSCSQHLHADGVNRHSSAPSGSHFQKCRLLWLSARNWGTSITWTVRVLKTTPQAPGSKNNYAKWPYHKEQAYSFLKCLPRSWLQTLPISFDITGGGVDRVKENFLRKKKRNQYLWFPFFGRGK